MFEINPWILEVLAVIILCVRWKLISLAAHFALRYGEEVKRTIKEKTNQVNMTAGRF
ncbi:MAG: hypothetical protein V1915_02165 [Candidatus Bathyarchaeota archaeon]